MFRNLSTLILAIIFTVIRSAKHPAVLVVLMCLIFESTLLGDVQNAWLSPYEDNGYIRNPETGEWRELTDEEAELIFNFEGY